MTSVADGTCGSSCSVTPKFVSNVRRSRLLIPRSDALELRARARVRPHRALRPARRDRSARLPSHSSLQGRVVEAGDDRKNRVGAVGRRLRDLIRRRAESLCAGSAACCGARPCRGTRDRRENGRASVSTLIASAPARLVIAAATAAGSNLRAIKPTRRRGALDLGDDRGPARRTQRRAKRAPLAAPALGALAISVERLARLVRGEHRSFCGVELVENVGHRANSNSAVGAQRLERAERGAVGQMLGRATFSPSRIDSAAPRDDQRQRGVERDDVGARRALAFQNQRTQRGCIRSGVAAARVPSSGHSHAVVVGIEQSSGARSNRRIERPRSGRRRRSRRSRCSRARPRPASHPSPAALPPSSSRCDRRPTPTT